MTSASALTSGALKSTLLRAWRERWSDEQWSVNVKQCLPRHLAVEGCQLSDLLLQQALIGSSPNMRILSYFKYAVSTQMVTYTAAMTSAMTYNDLEKPYCMGALLDLLAGFVSRVSSAGSFEDSFVLAVTLLHLLNWLLGMLSRCLERLTEVKTGHEVVEVTDKCGAVVLRLLSDESNVALLQIAKVGHPDVFQSIEVSETTSRNWFKCMVATPNELRGRLETSLQALTRLKRSVAEPQPILDVSFHPLNASLNVLINMEVIFKPTNPIAALLSQVKVIQRLQGLSTATVVCELLRSCMMGMVDSYDMPDKVQWVAFTFLKLPQLFVQLAQELKLRSVDVSVSHSIEQGIDNLLDYVALLDMVDTKHNCDCLHLLVELFTKYSLLSEAQYQNLMKRRKAETQRLVLPDQLHANAQPTPQTILRADSTVAQILGTLVVDTAKNQEERLGVLSQMLNATRFELILAAAAATGRLQSLAVKLVKFNEFVCQMDKMEAESGAPTRSLLFDTSFLMLVHITQVYGVEMITQSSESAALFFTQWAKRWLPGEGRHTRIDNLPPPDPAKVESLLRQFNPGGELETNMVRWPDLAHNAPFAIQEILNAWEYGALSSENIEAIVRNLKRLCCLPVIVALWLRAYIGSIDASAHAKPLEMLSLLSSPATTTSEVNTDQHYKERSQLMHTVLSRLAPPTGATCDTVETQMTRLFVDKMFLNGRIDVAMSRQLHALVTLAGPQCICEHLLKHLLSVSRQEDLNKSVALICSIFLTNDLLRFCVALFSVTLPALLTIDAPRLHLLVDPRGNALARLCIICLVALESTQALCTDGVTSNRGMKRRRSELDIEDDSGAIGGEDPPNKLRRMPSSGEASISMATGSFNITDMMSPKDECPSSSSSAYDQNEPLHKALGSLMRLFERTLVSAEANPRSCFVVSFLQQLVLAGEDVTTFVKHFMPVTMVPSLIQCMPGKFDVNSLLQLSELSSARGRKAAAKVICRNARYQRTTTAEQ